MCDFSVFVFFFKQKTAYEMRISDWSSDVCSSDLQALSSPLMTFPPSRKTMLHMPKTAIQNTSEGPNNKVAFDNGGANSMRANALAMPPRADDTTATCSANPPSPRCAMG